MKSTAMSVGLAGMLTLAAGAVHAEHGVTVLGAALGGAAGAAVGHSIGDDRGDVILWSALGGAAGAAIGQSLAREDERETVVYRRIHVHEHPVYRPRRVIYGYDVPPRGPGWHRHGFHHHWKRHEAWHERHDWDREWDRD